MTPTVDLLSPLAFTTPGFAEIVFLVLLALLIFGPEKLPDMARSAGRTLSRFKAEANSTLDELKSSVDVQELRETANVDELRGVAKELRSTSAELERTATEAASTKSPSRRAAGDKSSPADPAEPVDADDDEFPPFDPDAP